MEGVGGQGRDRGGGGEGKGAAGDARRWRCEDLQSWDGARRRVEGPHGLHGGVMIGSDDCETKKGEGGRKMGGKGGWKVGKGGRKYGGGGGKGRRKNGMGRLRGSKASGTEGKEEG